VRSRRHQAEGWPRVERRECQVNVMGRSITVGVAVSAASRTAQAPAWAPLAAKPSQSVGYGLPHWTWLGADLNAVAALGRWRACCTATES
jgi:hypothetical protein